MCQKWETLSTVETMPCPGRIIERLTLCCKTFQNRRSAGVLTSFQALSWDKALTWKTGIFPHNFKFPIFLVLRKHLIFPSSAVFPWNDTTQFWSYRGKKTSSDISLKIPGSQLPLEGQPTDVSLISNQVFQLRSMEPKLS